MLDIEALKQKLKIDKSRLDDEVAQQPMLFYEIAEQFEQASAEADFAKEQLATADAGLDGKIRIDLSRSEDRITEAMVRNGVQLDKKHEAAFKSYIEAKTRAGELAALKDAFRQRGFMLRDLVGLHSASYFEQSSMNADKAQYRERRRIIAEARDARE